MLQFQKGDKLAVMKSTDSTIINRYFDVAGVEVTQGYAFKRLRLGGAQSAREAGVFSEEVKKQMSHASSAHKRNYLKQLPKTMKDMVAGAGHSQQTILLGRSAVSARHTKEFQDLYWSVCPTKDPGFRARVQGWLQLEKCELASSLMHMVDCLEDMAEVLLQDLAVK